MKSTIYTTTAIVIAILAAAASGQDGLPDDVRRLLPQADPPMAAPNDAAAKSSEQPANGNDDTVDQQYSRALLRYQNIGNQTLGLNEKWHAELTERLERVESFLKSLEDQAPDNKATATAPADRHTVRRMDPDAEDSPIDMTSVRQPATVSNTRKSETDQPAGANPTVSKDGIVGHRAEQLDALADWCEKLAHDLRLAAKQLRDGN